MGHLAQLVPPRDHVSDSLHVFDRFRPDSTGTWLDFEAFDAQQVVALAIEEYSPHIGIAFSGSEDVILLDMAAKVRRPFRVFCLDTGRLHPETYEFLERVRERYRIDIETFVPRPEAVQELVRRKGLFSFYRDGHQECCHIRKVEPLHGALTGLAAWVTGQRRDHNPSTRSSLPVAQLDPNFATPEHPLVKFNPLAGWTSSMVWSYICEHKVPYNPLHERGFLSIGCQPCTRPIHPGQHEREGRWWWEADSHKECGLHASSGEAENLAGADELSSHRDQPSSWAQRR